jgi:hypothetical protein
MPLFLTEMIALLLQAVPAHAPDAPAGYRAGDVYEITNETITRFSGAGISDGHSYDRDMMVERVIAVRNDGVELEYDLPSEATAEDRARVWQFPARVLKPTQGPRQLLNGPELVTRVDRWLAAANLPRSACGHWYFTWNAFQIQCDPASVLQSLAAVDLTTQELRDGAVYRDPLGAAPAALRREPHGSGGVAFVAELAVDPETVLREQAGSEAALTEIMGDAPEVRAMRAAQAPRRISGTIRIRFEADAVGRTLRRIRVIELVTERTDGQRENRTITETIGRRPASARASQ